MINKLDKTREKLGMPRISEQISPNMKTTLNELKFNNLKITKELLISLDFNNSDNGIYIFNINTIDEVIYLIAIKEGDNYIVKLNNSNKFILYTVNDLLTFLKFYKK